MTCAVRCACALPCLFELPKYFVKDRRARWALRIFVIMKEKGVSSLEELIDSARAHGVRLVACQMSMDIMGIKKEELIDGVELGGVSTFLGSGEQSDMSLFI